LELLTKAVRENGIKTIVPKRSQGIEAALSKAPYRLFLQNEGPVSSNQKNLLVYCKPTSVTEYLAANAEASFVRSAILNEARTTVVAIFDPQTSAFCGQDGVLAAMASTSSTLCAASLDALTQLDQWAAAQLCGQRQDVVIVVGSGGREHALAVALAKSPLVAQVVCCPGNGGTAVEGGKITNAPGGQDNATVMALATNVGAHMVVVGPEGPLVDGLVDELAVACPSVKVFGPTKAAAELEASKVWKRRLPGAL
jgi:hypothetical protein